mgnify:CR=1 FL=1
MRIISGTHRGRRISPPKNLLLRPTTDKAKEALFNIINNRYFFNNKTMLDLFSGTGSIAFEFASRGVEKAVAIDHNIHCVEFINTTSRIFEFNMSAIQADGLKYAENCKERFDFIFADPPYSYQYYHELKKVIVKNNLIKKDGLLIIEHDKDTIFEEKNVEVREYGRVLFSLFPF